MDIDLAGLDRETVYGIMTQAIIPRPIAWVLTDCGEGVPTPNRWNLAPFSYFNGACSDPPLTVFSIGQGMDGRDRKDTYRNIADRHRFVIHIAPASDVEVLHRSSGALPWGQSEVEALDLDLTDWDWPVPRLSGAPVALACELVRFIEVAPNQEQVLVLSRTDRLWVDDRAASYDEKGRATFDPMSIDPLCRLGAGQYARLKEAFRPDSPTLKPDR